VTRTGVLSDLRIKSSSIFKRLECFSLRFRCALKRNGLRVPRPVRVFRSSSYSAAGSVTNFESRAPARETSAGAAYRFEIPQVSARQLLQGFQIGGTRVLWPLSAME
jgi:hypothetical protein